MYSTFFTGGRADVCLSSIYNPRGNKTRSFRKKMLMWSREGGGRNGITTLILIVD